MVFIDELRLAILTPNLEAAMARATEAPGGLLLTFALKREAYHLSHTARRKANIVITGMGPERAEAEITRAIERLRPHTVITAGVAGALCPSLCVGDVVVEDDHLGLPAALARHGAKEGSFYYHPHLATRKDELRRLTNAVAVEMESGRIRDICKRKGVHTVTIRAISDDHTFNYAPVFEGMITERGGTHYWNALRALVQQPGISIDMARLWRDTRIATKALGVVLHHAVEAL